MRRLVITALCALPAITFAQEKAFVIKGKIGKLNAPVKAYLDKRENGVSTLDSVVLKNGTFQFKGTVKAPVLAMMVLDHTGEGMGAQGMMNMDRHLLYRNPATSV
ncbi:DUF4369 domain-containing protein [Chitinophaga sedimenti]|uniref:DUF4369 domain-containing protein n=1 Tax=Chitinophaga sedimenti TaxID=2033606 RepID=UPI0020062D57|nr:DUF4369 domain-containing protein [Chitinophaga sedimenti]MCK7557781.1 DUF4369 domain-containing protein [Chitinophaga sedimenti]